MIYPFKTLHRVGIRTCSDYSPFGVELDGRTVSGGYRYGYQGSEKDNETKGNGNSYTTEFRQLDPRLGRWLSVDPFAQNAPDITPYRYGFNSPISFNDQNGLFEKKKDAKKYNRRHHLKGKTSFNTKSRQWEVNTEGRSYSKGDDNGFAEPNELKHDGVITSYRESWECSNSSKHKKSNNSNSWLKGISLDFFSDGFSKSGSLSISPFKDNIKEQSPEIQKEWKKRRNKSKSLEQIITVNAAILMSPVVIYETALVAPTAISISADLSWKSFLVKFSVSASSQAIVNKEINIVGATADGVFGYGLSSVIGSAINVNYNLIENNWSYQTLFKDIKTDQFLLNSSVGILIGYNCDYLGKFWESQGLNSTAHMLMNGTPFQFLNSGINEYNKKK